MICINSHFEKGLRISLSGLVQGSGVRPFIRNLAKQMEIAGNVRNTGSGVVIDAWANEDTLEQFVAQLQSALRPEYLQKNNLDGHPSVQGFDIVESHHSVMDTEVSPDVAICSACVSEVLDKSNRRYKYLLNSCAQCGPRFSVITGIPFDRKQSSYADYKMCETCQKEYDSHTHRRSHAQFNACADCGPAYYQLDEQGRHAEYDSGTLLGLVSDLVRQGKIIAIKGVGGFHLYCDAGNPATIAALRTRKRRPHKPLAVMYPDVESVRADFHVSDLEAQTLSGAQRPIVLLQSKSETRQGAVASGLRTVGLMLPYTALHVLLLRELGSPLIATSANVSGMPICVSDVEACEQLFSLADAVFSHDRKIHHRLDDSVVCANGDGIQVMRRGRAYAPLSISLPSEMHTASSSLAFGTQLKNTFCYTRKGKAYLSAHMGDLQDASVYENYISELKSYGNLFKFAPDKLARDANLEFAASHYAAENKAENQTLLMEVQHHHAHIVSCLADNLWPLSSGPVIGVAFDGFGLGDDGAAWGGEWLLADYKGYTRVGHLETMPLFGGERAMREPWRNLLAYLVKCFGGDETQALIESGIFSDRFKGKPLSDSLASLVNGKHMSSSSMGRLFDAVASAVGICFDEQSYEGQAASELEALVDSFDNIVPYKFEIADIENCLIMETLSMWVELLADLESGVQSRIISARFHTGLAKASVYMVKQISDKLQLTNTVALSGGVFQNQLLLKLIVEDLQNEGFQVLTHRQVPANDGGVSLGQAVVACAERLSGTVSRPDGMRV